VFVSSAGHKTFQIVVRSGSVEEVFVFSAVLKLRWVRGLKPADDQSCEGLLEELNSSQAPQSDTLTDCARRKTKSEVIVVEEVRDQRYDNNRNQGN
jgi:hypothetical protein